MTLGLLCFAGHGESSFHDFHALCLAEVKSARCVINVAGPYMLTQGELMWLVNTWFIQVCQFVIFFFQSSGLLSSTGCYKCWSRAEAGLPDLTGLPASEDWLLHFHGRPLLWHQRRDSLVASYHSTEHVCAEEQGRQEWVETCWNVIKYGMLNHLNKSWQLGIAWYCLIFSRHWGHMRTYEDIWGHMRTYEDIWGHMRTYEDIKERRSVQPWSVLQWRWLLFHFWGLHHSQCSFCWWLPRPLHLPVCEEGTWRLRGGLAQSHLLRQRWRCDRDTWRLDAAFCSAVNFGWSWQFQLQQRIIFETEATRFRWDLWHVSSCFIMFHHVSSLPQLSFHNISHILALHLSKDGFWRNAEDPSHDGSRRRWDAKDDGRSIRPGRLCAGPRSPWHQVLQHRVRYRQGHNQGNSTSSGSVVQCLLRCVYSVYDTSWIGPVDEWDWTEVCDGSAMLRRFRLLLWNASEVRAEDLDANMSKISEDKHLGIWRGPNVYSYFDTRIVRPKMIGHKTLSQKC